MVQYMEMTPSNTAGRGRRNSFVSVYWKLGFYDSSTIQEAKEFLQSNGYYTPKTTNKNAIRELVGRYQRGLLSYRKCNLEELRAFCKGRGLNTKAKTVSGLAKALEEADDVATFPRFFALPAELRNAIYEFHVRSFGGVPAVHQQPPLVVASKQLRDEALPLFYECATFQFTFWNDSLIRPLSLYRQQARDGPEEMFKMPKKHVGFLKQAEIRILRDRELLWCEIYFNHSPRLQPNLAVTVLPSSRANRYERNLCASIQKNLRDVVQHKLLNDEEWKMTEDSLRLVEKTIMRSDEVSF